MFTARTQRTLTGAIWGFPKPTIAALPGAAAGLGAAIALSTDLRVAAHEGFLTMQYINVGMPGDYGGTWLITLLRAASSRVRSPTSRERMASS